MYKTKESNWRSASPTNGRIQMGIKCYFHSERNKVKRLAGGSTNPVTGELIDMPNMPVGWLGKENVAPRVILTEGGTMTDIYVYNELTKDNTEI